MAAAAAAAAATTTKGIATDDAIVRAQTARMHIYMLGRCAAKSPYVKCVASRVLREARWLVIAYMPFDVDKEEDASENERKGRGAAAAAAQESIVPSVFEQVRQASRRRIVRCMWEVEKLWERTARTVLDEEIRLRCKSLPFRSWHEDAKSPISVYSPSFSAAPPPPPPPPTSSPLPPPPSASTSSCKSVEERIVENCLYTANLLFDTGFQDRLLEEARQMGRDLIPFIANGWAYELGFTKQAWSSTCCMPSLETYYNAYRRARASPAGGTITTNSADVAVKSTSSTDDVDELHAWLASYQDNYFPLLVDQCMPLTRRQWNVRCARMENARATFWGALPEHLERKQQRQQQQHHQQHKKKKKKKKKGGTTSREPSSTTVIV